MNILGDFAGGGMLCALGIRKFLENSKKIDSIPNFPIFFTKFLSQKSLK